MAEVFATSFWTPETMVLVSVTSWRVAETAASALTTSAFWEWEVSNDHHSSDGTHVKDLKNLVQVQPPGGNRFFIFLRVETPRNRIPSAPLGEPRLNVCHCPAIEDILY